jgi:tetratricopeptide (TPR) repeat protein
MLRHIAALAALLLLAAGPETTPKVPTLYTPAHPDTVPPESEPAPLLIPGRGSPGDTAFRAAADRAREQYRFGRQFEDEGRLGPALASYNNAVRLDPKIPDAYYRMGKILAGAGSMNEAVKCFAAEVTHHPERTDAARELGLGLARTGDTARAITQLELLVKRNPKDGESMARARVRLHRGRASG